MLSTKNNQGIFITLEGVEGVGKSSALEFFAEYLKNKGLDYAVTREPGGTPIAEQIRAVVLSDHQELMHPDTELLLMFAGRTQHLENVIKPALRLGKFVICDRFTDASYAYQGGGRGILPQRIKIIEDWVQKGLQPNLTFLFDAPIEVGLKRINSRAAKDRIEKEQLEFFERVRSAYLERAYQHPERFKIIDATQALEKVQEQLKNTIENSCLLA